MSFLVNGTERAHTARIIDWQNMTFSLPAGSMTLRWSYTKDATISSGSDRAWLDEVDFAPNTGPSVPVIVRQPVSQDVNPGTTVTLAVQALGTAPLSYQWRFEGQNLSDVGNIL